MNFQAFLTQISQFGFVGVLTTTFGIICNYVLLDIMRLPLYPVYISVFLVGVLLSYLLNSRFTFKEKTNLKTGVRYYALYIVGLVVGLILLYIFDRIFDYSDFILTLLVVPPRFLLTFILLKTIVFVEKTAISE